MDGADRESLEQAAIVAHQMKSPVGTLQTILRTLLGGFTGELTEQQRAMLQSGERKCAEAMETINALLSLAEASARQGPGEPADAVAAAREAYERYRQSASERDIELAFRLDADSAYVCADAERLTEAFAALVDNALKYTPEGGRVEFHLSLDEELGLLKVRVSDSGIGIPEDEREGLFRPFFRASNARRVAPSGTGLGLAFVRAVVRAAGGSVAAGASHMGGAEFTLALPVTRAAPAALGQRKAPSMRVVVVGGVAAGPKIAAKVMRLRPDAEVTIVEKGRVLSYAGCGLPYYISGLVKDQRELISTPEGVVRGPEYFERVKNVRVMNRTEAVRIDRSNRRILVRDLVSGAETWLPYDKLALATGAVPIVPRIPGVHLENIFTLHGIQHAEGIKAELAQSRAKDVTIVGGGLIGVEMAESLVSAGCRVTLLEMRSQLLPQILDPEMAELVRAHFESKGVRVMLNTRVTGFEGDGKIRRVVTERQDSFPADMVIMGVGVRPNVALAREAGLELGKTGAIKVDEHMRTSDPDIYAAGDCVECIDLITSRPCYVPLGSTANKQGRVAAINICGGDDIFPGIVGTTVCKVFDYTVARAGLTERHAKQLGFDVVTALTPGLDRAHFMPNAAMIITKLIGDARSGRLLGIQVVGPGEAAKRVDVAVAAMTAGMSVDAVSKLDLCYAPSYSDALDNLHTACNVMRNKLQGHMVGISPAEVRSRLQAGEDILLLDVRSHAELDEARIEGAVHIPIGALRGRLGELPRDREIVVFSRVSLSAYEASFILRAAGFENVKVMDGGITMWPHASSEAR